jgi:hypothetical protein
VRASGEWNVRPNPACAAQPPQWPCSSVPATGPFAAYPDAFAGPVLVVAAFGARLDAIPMRAVSETDGVGLTQRDFARSLLAVPGVNNPSVQEFGNTGPTVYSYLIDGAYTVTVTQIASPIGISEGAQEADGTRTFTVEPLYGLQFINPIDWNEPPGAIGWFFFPGDSVSDEPGDITSAIFVGECRYQTTCRYRPPGPGRMQVEASVETQRARVRSELTPPQQEPELRLKCLPSTNLARGDAISCSAEIQPPSPGADVSWAFDDSAGHHIPGPENSSGWGGQMVISGMLRVFASVDGKSLSDSAWITVQPRNWPSIRVRVRQGGHGELPSAAHVTQDADLMQTRFDTIPASLFSVTELSSGPNTGWAFIPQAVRTLPLVVDVSDAWKHGSAWYSLQHWGPTGQVDANGNPIHFCAHNELPQVFQAALEHEGAVTGPIVSHVAIFQRWFANHPAQDSIEKAIVFVPELGGYDARQAILNREVATVESDARSDPDQGHTNVLPPAIPGKVQPAQLPCQMRFFP